MRRRSWFAAPILLALPGWAANPKFTVSELKDYVAAAHHAGASDANLAKGLSGIELSEGLPATEVGHLIGLLPGPLSTEQLYVLEARNAALPQPRENLAMAPAPDVTAQDAMLARARDWSAKVYARLPPLSAQCMIARFQDGYAVPVAGASTGDKNREAPQAADGPDVRLINKHVDRARFVHGDEVATVFTETAEPGENGVWAVVQEPLNPNSILQDAMESGSLRFSRWESVDGLRLAVFWFEVDRNKAHSGLVYRARMPERKDLGIENNAGVVNNSTMFDVILKNFSHRVGYGGEIFLEPESGIVLRTITETAFKPNDIFHAETIRTDYARIQVGGKTLVVPVRRFKITAFVPMAQQTAKAEALRHNFVTEDFRDFQIADVESALP